MIFMFALYHSLLDNLQDLDGLELGMQISIYISPSPLNNVEDLMEMYFIKMDDMLVVTFIAYNSKVYMLHNEQGRKCGYKIGGRFKWVARGRH